MKLIIPFILLFIVSCQNDASHNANTDDQKPEELAEEKKPEADYQCVAKVSGMICKMGCGGAIRKKLTSLKGVSRVTLDYEGDSTNDSNYTTLINDTKVVGKSRSAGVGGDFEEKVTVEANTAGVSTAFTPTGNATLFMSNKVSVISPNPTAAAVVYIQQVQTTGSA